MGYLQVISGLTPRQRWVQFSVSFPLIEAKKIPVLGTFSGVPPSHNPWVPWMTVAFIVRTPGYLLLIVMSGLITWNSRPSPWTESKNLGALKKWKQKPSPQEGYENAKLFIYLLSFPMGPCPRPLRLPYQYVLFKHLGNGASASPRRWFQRPRPR